MGGDQVQCFVALKNVVPKLTPLKIWSFDDDGKGDLKVAIGKIYDRGEDPFYQEISSDPIEFGIDTAFVGLVSSSKFSDRLWMELESGIEYKDPDFVSDRALGIDDESNFSLKLRLNFKFK